MTRSKKKPQVSESPRAVKRTENSWILFLKNNLFENDNFTIITLPNPATGTPSKYCLDNKNKKIYEVILFSEPYRSWFINETVKSDGNVQMVTPIHPLFLVLPRLRKQCMNKAMPLEDLLSEKGFDKILDYIHSLEDIGDLKGPPELKAYKYNEEKTLSWLKGRVTQLAKVLRAKNMHVTSGVASATFVPSNINNDSIDEEFYLKYANGMVSEYLDDYLLKKLEEHFDFQPDIIESVGKKRKSELKQNVPNKKVKSDPSDVLTEVMLNSSVENGSESKKVKPLTAKEKARQKAASGTKTISAFFTKK